MAKLSARNRLIDSLRRYPHAYSPLRAAYRAISRLPVEILRRVGPSSQMSGLPRDFFSGVDLVRSGHAPGRVALNEQAPPTFPDDSLVGLCGYLQDKFQPWPVFWMRQDNAYLSGRSLCLRDTQGRLLAESTFSQTGKRTDPAYSHFATRPKLTLEGNVTSLVSTWMHGNTAYWHFVMDGLTRLALLNELPPDTRILIPPLNPSQMQCLADMGLEKRCLVTDATAIAVEHYYFLAPSAMTGCFNSFGIQFLRDQFLPRAAPRDRQPRRFYIGREGFTRSLDNEREVRGFFRARGWETVLPEKLTFLEQVALFASAEAVVALHGSALTNLIWCRPGCRVLELAPSNFLNGNFQVTAGAVGVAYDFLLCPADGSRLHADLDALTRKLEAAGL